MRNIETQLVEAMKDAPAQIAKYIACKEDGHNWTPYKPVKGKPLLIRKCRNCKVTEINTR
jgi:hypothetical protein